MAGDLRTVELDFDPIKENLKTFLRSQDYFTDYDFEGSALSILLDILAYDTHYKAYLANMVINERFIDTAIKRASVISHAKALGYVPRSARAAKAIVDVSVFGTSTSYAMTLDKYTPFTCDVDGQSFTFVTTKTYSAIPSGEYNAYVFKNVELYEGSPISYNHLVQSSDKHQIFKIPAENVDTSTLSVIVQKSNTDTKTEIYEYADSASLLGPDDKVYFLQEGVDGYFYIYFGDGVLGKSLEAGNIIKMTYLVTSGSTANTNQYYNQQFTLSGTIGGYYSSNVIIETTSPSIGGAEKQSIDDIRFLAPKNYSTNGRAVTIEDHKALLQINFPEIDSIEVWGGEENTPPIYGKIFICIKPVGGYILSDDAKESIKNYLGSKSIVGMQYEFVDPEFMYITVSSDIKYDPNGTNNDSTQIADLAKTIISRYFTENLQKFEANLYISKLQSLIDSVDVAIKGNNTTISLQKRIEPTLMLNSTYFLYFNNKLSPYSFISSAFNILVDGKTVTVAIKDVPTTVPPTYDGTGTLTMFNIETNEIVYKTVGTINYATGQVVINDIVISGYPSNMLYDIRFNCKPQDQVNEISSNIIESQKVEAYMPTPTKHQILMLDDSILVPGYFVNTGVSVTAAPIA